MVGAARTTHRLMCALLAADTGCAVISVDYRLAPEHPFPAPTDDARDALAYLAEQRLHLSLDPDFLAVGGDSAGGHLAAQAAQAVHDRVRPGLVTAQLLVCPATMPAFGSESYSAFAQGPGLTRDEMRWYWAQFIGEAALDRPLAEQDARLFLMADPPAHLPPDTVVIVAAHDVLRDDGLAYADHLVQHGAQVVTIEASGMTHGFARLQPEAERAREWMRRAAHAFVGMIGGMPPADASVRRAYPEPRQHAACDEQREVIVYAGLGGERAHRFQIGLADEIGRCAGVLHDLVDLLVLVGYGGAHDSFPVLAVAVARGVGCAARDHYRKRVGTV